MKRVLPFILAGCTATALGAQGFEQPVRLSAGGEAINVDVGHAAPFYHDMNGDGVRDLLVGQFGSGKLRIYTNTGTDAKPEFAEFKWFEAGGDIATVPTG